MYKAVQFTPIILFSFLTLALFAYMIHFTDDDLKMYHELIRSNKKENESSSITHIGKQTRINSQKDLWFSNDLDSYHVQLHCTDSEITFSYKGDEYIDIKEMMNNVTCYFQEELYYLLPDGKEVQKDSQGNLTVDDDGIITAVAATETIIPMQKIRYFEGDVAQYDYKTNTLTAQDIAFTLFTIPGHTLNDIALHEKRNVIVAGTAKSAEFYIEYNKINFKAYRLKAHIHTQGKLS